MTRTKWMRLSVRDPAALWRWAGEQRARHLTDFRYRVINGREVISFRMVPGYAIQIGTRDIVVVCHVRPSRWQTVALRWRRTRLALAAALERRLAANDRGSALMSPAVPPIVTRGAEPILFPSARRPAP